MNSFLHRLDEIFKEKSENEKWMIILMIVVVIGYLAYSLFLPYAEAELNRSVSEKNKLKKSIINHKEYISSITVSGDRDFYIKKYDRDIVNIEKKIIETEEDIGFISSKLEELSPLLFNKESWSIFLNSITEQAKNQEVKIDYIDNEYMDNNGSFGHILEISVGCVGEYKNIAKFINQLEKNVLVTDIYGSSIYLDENASTTIADINISVWGINH
jgi:Tfp pilus assembly protein PilO